MSRDATMKPREAAIAAMYQSGVGNPRPALRAATASAVWWRAASVSNGSTRSPNSSEQAIECARQGVPAPACRQHGDPEQHLRQGDPGEVERFGDLLVQPGPHGGIWRRLHRLGDHIGVEHDHSNFIGFAGDLSRVWSMAAMSSSVSPTLRPRAASESPSRTPLCRLHGPFQDIADLGLGAAAVLGGEHAQRTMHLIGHIPDGDRGHDVNLPGVLEATAS